MVGVAEDHKLGALERGFFRLLPLFLLGAYIFLVEDDFELSKHKPSDQAVQQID